MFQQQVLPLACFFRKCFNSGTIGKYSAEAVDLPIIQRVAALAAQDVNAPSKAPAETIKAGRLSNAWDKTNVNPAPIS